MRDYLIVHEPEGSFVQYTVQTVGETQYDLYVQGELPPNYPVPALADTATVLCLTNGAYNRAGCPVVWDEIWRDNVPYYVPVLL